MPPNAQPPVEPRGAPPDADRLFGAFRASRNSQEMLALAAATPDDALDALQTTVEARLVEVEGDEAQALRARLASLRALRAERADDIQQMRDLARQLAEMPEDERLLAAFVVAASTADIMRLVAGTADDALDRLEVAARAKLADVEGDERDALQRRLDDLRRWRAAERDARRALAPLGEEGGQALAGRLVEWIRTPDWDASQAFLTEHAAELLTDAGAAAMTLLRMNNAGQEQVELHANLLAACREHGSDAAYEQLRWEQAQGAQLQRLLESPLGQAVMGFIRAEDDAAAALLAGNTLLTTADARNVLEQFLEVARQQGDAPAAERIADRLALWQEAWRRRVGGPLHRRDAAEERQPESAQPWRERLERQPLAGERGAQYTIVTAVNSAIGENAAVLNIYNVGDLPLAWGCPKETRPDLAAGAVGRVADLDELHRRLHGGEAALVGVRGLAGIGKTVLAAMYATHHATDYPGGVIWLDVGPRRRTREDATPLLQRLAAYAYNRDPRVAWLDQVVFAPDAVQMLLGNHGRLLLIFDDVWSQEIVAVLKAAAPPGSAVLLTTRDRRVAYAVGGPDAIQELDLLTEADARVLLQKAASGLSDDLAGAVAHGLGFHAQALALAGAALYLRKPHRYERTAEELLSRVARGEGFGNLPDLDETDVETNVEIALKYSYDYLGEDPTQGALRQACFRGLGAFAQEATFDAAAAAAIWQMEPAAAEELLIFFDRLALVRESAQGGRWQQHAILRVYAFSLQTDAERLTFPQRHVDHYLALAHASIPAATDRVEQEFKQIEHTFSWCRRHSPGRATALANIASQVMFIRGRAMQAGEWLRISMDAANQTGDRTGTANTLKSLGDLERRLGNLDAARRHYDAALPLYEAEQARLGRANTLMSLGDLESRLGNLDAARRHYDAALQLYRLEQEPGGIINTLVSQARLEAGIGNIEQAIPLYEQAFRIADQTGFANHPVVQDVRREYEGIRGLASTQHDPLAAGLAALLGADSDPALAQALTEHPILREADALFALAGLLNQALAAQQGEAVARLTVFLVALLEIYNNAHGEQIEAEQHQAVIGLCEGAIPVAAQISGDPSTDSGQALARAFRQQAGWACNTLGNHYADAVEDLEQAVAAYTRGLSSDPNNAMLLRNRAGVHLDRRDGVAAQADIKAAAALEPNAPRLVELREQLAQLRQSSSRDAQ
jgi:tetratricopeptide (TPR) repeat protein